MAHLVSLGLGAVAILAHLGASLWIVTRRRIRDEMLRLRVARHGEDLLAALAPLPARCRALQESARLVAQAYHLSAAQERSVVAELGSYPGLIRNFEQQVQQALKNLVALRGRDLENRSDSLSALDAEICLLLEEISDREALWSAELRATSLPQVA